MKPTKKENLLQSLFKQMSLFLCVTSAIASESYRYKDPTARIRAKMNALQNVN